MHLPCSLTEEHPSGFTPKSCLLTCAPDVIFPFSVEIRVSEKICGGLKAINYPMNLNPVQIQGLDLKHQ